MITSLVFASYPSRSARESLTVSPTSSRYRRDPSDDVVSSHDGPSQGSVGSVQADHRPTPFARARSAAVAHWSANVVLGSKG